MTFDFRCFYTEHAGIAITGGTGFIGQGIIKASNQSDFCRMPIESVPKGATIIHCAADLASSKAALLENIERDLWLTEYVRDNHAALVYASTNNIYKLQTDCKIEDASHISDYYSASKIFGEKIIQDLLDTPYCIVRIADVFGKNQRHGLLFQALEKAIQENTPLQQYGYGLKQRSYIYQPELSNMLWYLATHMQKIALPKIINACYQETPTVAEIIKTISKLTDIPVETVATENDLSSHNIRTMQPGPFGAYAFRFPSLEAALKDYVAQCNLETA